MKYQYISGGMEDNKTFLTLDLLNFQICHELSGIVNNVKKS